MSPKPDEKASLLTWNLSPLYVYSHGQSRSPRDIFIQCGQLDIAKPDFWQLGLTEIENLLTQAETIWKEVKN